MTARLFITLKPANENYSIITFAKIACKLSLIFLSSLYTTTHHSKLKKVNTNNSIVIFFFTKMVSQFINI